jgi:hypothetical protein
MKNGSICSKHGDILSMAIDIQKLVLQCTEDGQNMERGLQEKNKEIRDLEKQLSESENALSEALYQIDSLKESLKVAELAEESLKEMVSKWENEE